MMTRRAGAWGRAVTAGCEGGWTGRRAPQRHSGQSCASVVRAFPAQPDKCWRNGETQLLVGEDSLFDGPFLPGTQRPVPL